MTRILHVSRRNFFAYVFCEPGHSIEVSAMAYLLTGEERRIRARPRPVEDLVDVIVPIGPVVLVSVDEDISCGHLASTRK